ncbi:DUF2225 domain-containing protein [Bacillus sp. FJAT-49705]|uniref:DUF2225 domain-containing protein n=1 Tax=Cytobacillus citreus TaxID=2833586 RepID=A0ABS5NUW4_9BACI|nr:DUF2225 domain-containing protein [Cytobacillus citreus]MBS4190699.1 DUF2225 domain-containing protein [Cytobacillus citreus]
MTEIEPIFDKNCECRMCKKSFTTKKLRSRFIKVTSYDTDFCPIYTSDETNPLLYHVSVCPHCGYSSTKDFSPYFPPGTVEDIQDKVCHQWVSRDFGQKRSITDAIKTYKLAVYSGLLKKEKHVIIAGIYVRLAWLYRSTKNEEQEQRFLKLATKAYLDSYMADDYNITQVSEVKMLYLIGELSRRTNQNEQAVKFFSKVIEKQNKTVESGIIDMARERWYEIRENQKTEKQAQEI